MKRKVRRKKRRQFMTMGMIILLTVALVILVSKIFDFFLPVCDSTAHNQRDKPSGC